MKCFYYVTENDLEKLKGSSTKMSYTQNVCNNAVQCEDKDEFIIEVDDEIIETDKQVHINHYETLLNELRLHDGIPGLTAVYNRVRMYNPLIWYGKVFRNENICNDKDIKWYNSHKND